MLRRVLLICGVLSSLLYVAIDVLSAIFYGEYHSFSSQAISELAARGAPTERLVDPLFILYDVLLIAFGVGVWRSADGKRLMRVTAGLLVAIGAVGLAGPPFKMNMRGTGGVQGDVPHIALTGVIVLFILLAIGFGTFVRGRWFRFYSFATLLTLLVSGALTGFQAGHLAAGEPTPWIGVAERINVGGYLLWVLVLAISLLRVLRTTDPSSTMSPRFGERAATARAGRLIGSPTEAR